MTQTGQRDDGIRLGAAEVHTQRPGSVEHFTARRRQAQHDLAKSNNVRHKPFPRYPRPAYQGLFKPILSRRACQAGLSRVSCAVSFTFP